MKPYLLLLILLLGAAGVSADNLSLNADLSPQEQYRRLNLVLLIGQGVNEAMMTGLKTHAGGVDQDPVVDPDELKSPLIRIVDQESMLAGTAYLFRLAHEHGAEVGQRLKQLEDAFPEAIGQVSIDAVREDSILVRNAVADAVLYSGLAEDPGVESALMQYRSRTLELRNLMEYEQFDRELDRITDEAIASVGGKLDAYQRMFDDEIQDDTFDRHIRAAEYKYTGHTEFNEDAGKVAEQVMEGVVLSESQPDDRGNP